VSGAAVAPLTGAGWQPRAYCASGRALDLLGLPADQAYGVGLKEALQGAPSLPPTLQGHLPTTRN
jgi:hypothetical protein